MAQKHVITYILTVYSTRMVGNLTKKFQIPGGSPMGGVGGGDDRSWNMTDTSVFELLN